MRELHRVGISPDNVVGLSFYTPAEGYICQVFDLRYTADSGRTYISRSISNNVDYNGHTVNLTFGFFPKGVHAFDKNRLLVYGDYGNVPAILRSTDGGLHFKLVWHDQPAVMPDPDAVQAMIFPGNGNTGYAMERRRILKTTNKGESWQIVYNNDLLSNNFNTLQVLDVNTIIASNNTIGSGRLIISADGGHAWNSIGIPENQRIYSIHFSSQQNGWINLYARDQQKCFYQTTNGGSTWTLVNDPGKHPLEANLLHFVNDTTAFSIQEDGFMEVFKTIDGGRIWERVPKDNDFKYDNYPLSTFFFLNKDIFWTGGRGQQLQINTNTGGPVIPNARFIIDTTGFAATRQVKLLNRAGRQHRFQWFVNGHEIGTSYDAAYPHAPQSREDTVCLIAYNDTYRDTVEQIFYFPALPFIQTADPMVGGAGSVITLRGFNFKNAREVLLGGAEASFKILSDSVIEATAAYGATGDIIVRNYSGYGALPGFIYLPPPHIDAFTPSKGKTGNKIVLTGSNFEYVKQVLAGGLPVQSFNTLSPTQLEIILGSSGDGDIEVRTPGGSHSLAGFTALPEIFDFTPGKATQASWVSLTGSGLDNITGISIGGKAVTHFITHSPTLLEISIPENSSGNIVVNKGAATATKGTFTYLHKPVITNISPAAAQPGSTIVITGAHFSPVPAENVVSFGPVAGIVTQASATSLTVIVPSGSVYGPLHVTSNMLTTRSDKAFSPIRSQPGAITADAFSEPFNIAPPPGSYYKQAVPCDLDGDMKTDLLLQWTNSSSSYYEDSALILRNTTNGSALSFTERYPILLPKYKTLNIADVNNDGKPDICIVINDYTDSVLIYENYSTPGQLDFRRNYYKLVLPKNFDLLHDCIVTSGDIDADGKADLIVCAISGGTAVFRNLGNPGTVKFDTAYHHSYDYVRAFRLEDMDSDGKVDIITLNGFIRNLSTPGKLQLGEETILSAAPHNRLQVASADLNMDGKWDVIRTDPENYNIYVQKNTATPGTISFEAPQAIPAVYRAAGAIANDFDGDGKPDIAAFTNAGLATIFRNAGTSGNIRLMPPQRINSFNRNFFYPGIHTADFNNDSQADLLLYETGTPVIYLNQAKPLPVIVDATPGYATAGSEISIHGLNFSGATGVSFGGVPAASYKVISDTLLKAVVGNGGAGLLTITNNAGTGQYDRFTFGPSPVVTGITPGAAKAGATITIQGHHFEKSTADNIVLFGSLKAVIVNADTNELKVIVPVSAPHQPISVTARHLTGYSSESFRCIFDGANDVINESNFAPFISFPIKAGYGNYADLDGDGKLDIYARELINGTIPSGKMVILHNTSTLDSISFEHITDFSNTEYCFNYIDMDGDGKPDFVAGDTRKTTVYLNTSTPGNISLAPPATVVNHFQDIGGGVIMQDFDTDGKPDVLLVADRSITFYRNVSYPGQLAFGESFTLELTDVLPEDNRCGDVDGDGRIDIIAFAPYERMVVLVNNSTPGNISFREETLIASVPAWYPTVELKDLDGDHKPDISVLTSLGHSFLLRNLSTPGKLIFEESPYAFDTEHGRRFQDLDGDGKPDLMLQYEYTADSRTIKLQKNISTIGNFAFSQPYLLPTRNAYSSCFIADFNGDSKPEIATFVENTSIENALNIFPNITGNDVTMNNCADAPDSIQTNMQSQTYQWQIKSDTGFVNLTDNAEYTGSQTARLKMKQTPLTWNGQAYRCKTDTGYSVTYTLRVNANPVLYAGPDTVYCQYAEPLKIGTAPEEGLKYKWQEGSLDSGSYIMVKPSIDRQYVLVATNNAGCATRDTVNVALGIPGITPVVTENAEICPGGQAELIAGEGSSYRWYDSDNKPIPGATGKTLTVSATGFYYVTAFINGCLWHAGQIYVSSKGPLNPPSIIRSGNMLISSTDTASRWYRDNTPIPGAAGKMYTPEQPGTYTCRAVSNGCISENSNAIIISAQPFNDENVIASPNPVARSLYITFPYNTQPVDITLYDIHGNRLTEKATFTSQYELNMQPFMKGMYFVHLTKPDTGEVIVKKIVKQ